MKKLLAIALAALMLVPFAIACGGGNGGETEKPEIALVTDVGNIDDQSFNQGAWEGVVKFAKDNNLTYNYFRPNDDTTADRVETIKEAIDAGAKVVVCPGYLFETAIYEVQEKYPDTMFLLLDGQPNDGNQESPTYKTAANVHCILYQEEQSGFFAGYAAVMEGYRKLGFLGGMEIPAVQRFGYGFVQGCDAAANELGLAKDDINVNYWYCGGFAPSDEIKNKMSGWYTEGVEVIFACGGGIYLSAVQAADENDGKVIGVDTDQSNQSERIITSAMKGLTESVVVALTELYDNNCVWADDQAGKTAILGVADDCVGLPTAEKSWRLEQFTVEKYNEIYAKVKNGEIKVSNEIGERPQTTICNVDYQN